MSQLPPDSAVEPASTFDWKQIFHILRERLWLILLCLILALAGGYYHALHAPERYAAFAVVEVALARDRILEIEEVKSQDLSSEQVVNTMIQTMNSGVARRRIAKKYNLAENPEFLPPREEGPYDLGEAVQVLGECISVNLRTGTRLIDITARHSNPKIATLIADAVVEDFIESSLRQRADASALANNFLMKEAARLQEKVTASEQAVYDFRKENDAISLEEKQDILSRQLMDASAKLTVAKSDRLALGADIAKAKELAALPEELVQLPTIAESPRVVGLRSQLGTKVNEFRVTTTRYGPKHPVYLTIESELEALQNEFNEAVLEAASQLDERFAASQKLEAEFRQALEEQESKQLALNELTIRYNILTRELEADRALYDSVITRMREVGLTKGMEESPIQLVEAAWATSAPVEPDFKKILLASTLAGLVLGVGLALGLAMLDASFKTVDQAETVLNLPVLCAIPQTGRKTRLKEAGLAILNQPNGIVAESVRSLRASLALLGKSEDRRTFLFTSALSGEGKSFSAANYAISLAQQGLSTLLIDADLRQPTMSTIFFGTEEQRGLTAILVGRGTLELAQKTEVSGLSVLSAGRLAPNPAELLSGSKFPDLLKEAISRYDRVVIDSAPLIPVSDTLLLAPHVQSICLVVRAASTARRVVLRSCRALRDIGCKPVGVIFNCVPQNSHGFYYSYTPKAAYGRAGIYSVRKDSDKTKPEEVNA